MKSNTLRVGIAQYAPKWRVYMDGAAWEVRANKALHAHFLHNSVDPENRDLDPGRRF